MEQEDKGFNLIDVVRVIKELLVELKQKWLVVIAIIAIASVLGFLYALKGKAINYMATSTLMLESSKGGGMSGARALAGQLGLIGGSESSGLSEDKLLEIIKTETIIKSALFEKATIDSSTDILANHFIDVFDYRGEIWKNNDSLKNFKFQNSKKKLTIKENGVFKSFYGQTITDILKIEESKKSGIIKITVATPSPLFSIYFNEAIVNAVTDFYVSRITEKERKNVDVIQQRVDSIAGELREAEFALARWKDASNQLVKAQGMINEIRLRRNVEVANSIYIEGVKQLEISRFSLLEQTPILQVIDKPELPLSKTRQTSKVRTTIIGFIIGCVLACLFVVTYKKFNLIIAELKQKGMLK